MRASTGEPLPLPPLVHAYRQAGLPSAGDLGRLPDLGPRFRAIQSASATFLYAAFVDGASPADLSAALLRFHEACVQPRLHADTLRRRAGVVRHALAYLLRGQDPLPNKLDACLAPGGPYHV